MSGPHTYCFELYFAQHNVRHKQPFADIISARIRLAKDRELISLGYCRIELQSEVIFHPMSSQSQSRYKLQRTFVALNDFSNPGRFVAMMRPPSDFQDLNFASLQSQIELSVFIHVLHPHSFQSIVLPHLPAKYLGFSHSVDQYFNHLLRCPSFKLTISYE